MQRFSMILAFLIALATPVCAQNNKTETPVSRTTVIIPADPPQNQNRPARRNAAGQLSFGHQVVLNWTAPTTCADGSACTVVSFNIYKAMVACPSGSNTITATKIGGVNMPTVTYTDTNIVAPGSYCYYVTAVNPDGESTASNLAGGSLAQPLLAAPTNLTATLQ